MTNTSSHFPSLWYH